MCVTRALLLVGQSPPHDSAPKPLHGCDDLWYEGLPLKIVEFNFVPRGQAEQLVQNSSWMPENGRQESGRGLDTPYQRVKRWQCPSLCSFTVFSQNIVIRDPVE